MRNIFCGWKSTQENQKVCDERSFVCLQLVTWEERKQGACRDAGEGFYTFPEVPRKSVPRALQGTGNPSRNGLEDSSAPDASRKLPGAWLFLSSCRALASCLSPSTDARADLSLLPIPPAPSAPLPSYSSLSPTALQGTLQSLCPCVCGSLCLECGSLFLTLPPWLSPTYSTGRNVNVSCTQPHVN